MLKDKPDSKPYELAYAQSVEMMRHFDKLKYTTWTVYIAIVAGMYVASSSSKISDRTLIIAISIASIYFIFLSYRKQRNYQVFYHAAYAAELALCKMAKVPLAKYFKNQGDDILSPFPFIRSHEVVFIKTIDSGMGDKIFGFVPYFYLKVGFFFIVPVAVYLISLLDRTRDLPQKSQKIEVSIPRSFEVVSKVNGDPTRSIHRPVSISPQQEPANAVKTKFRDR